MSVVTNVILTFDILEDEEARIAEINEWIGAWDERQVLVDSLLADDAAFQRNETRMFAGYKAFQAPLYLAAFNVVKTEEFVGAVMAANWKYPDRVQCFVKEEWDDVFTDRVAERRAAA